MKFIIDGSAKKAYLIAEDGMERQVLYQIAPLIGLSGVPCNEHEAGIAGRPEMCLELEEKK